MAALPLSFITEPQEGHLIPSRRGRPSMLPVPANNPSPDWMDAWTGYELHQLSLGRSAATIHNRRSNVLAMARHLTAAGHGPAAVTKAVMQRYLLAQSEGRKGAGPAVLYEDLKSFWTWWASEFGAPSPMAAIPRPKARPRPVAVPTAGDLARVLKAAKGSHRDTSIILLLVESGLRRFELAALLTSDIDLKARTVLVRRGKGAKARISVFGDATAQALWRWQRTRPERLGDSLFGLTAGGVSGVISRLSRSAGVTLRPHQCRHLWAHANLSAGMNEGDLMVLGGWENSTQIHQTYGAVLKQERALAAGRAIQVGKLLR